MASTKESGELTSEVPGEPPPRELRGLSGENARILSKPAANVRIGGGVAAEKCMDVSPE
jgi:hypothetical protein|tara:strand:+ start:2636 stop:2812 length:177 start_codon:yes stop_codon:yes gene_type:complete